MNFGGQGGEVLYRTLSKYHHTDNIYPRNKPPPIDKICEHPVGMIHFWRKPKARGHPFKIRSLDMKGRISYNHLVQKIRFWSNPGGI